MADHRKHAGKAVFSEPLRRLMAIVFALLEQPRSRDELSIVGAAEPRDPSSVTRDINALRALGWEIRSRGGAPYHLITASVPLLVNPAEARALAATAEVASQAGLPDSDTLTALVARIPELVRRKAVADGRVSIQQSLVDYGAHATELATIRRALARGRQMRVLYRHPWHDRPKPYLLDAAELGWTDGTLILFAFCPELQGDSDSKKTREFRIDRVLSVETTSLACVRACPPKYPFTYRILPGLARAFDPPRTHRILDQGVDESLTVRGVANSEFRAQRYLLTLGAFAEAVEPSSLRERLIRELAETAALYQRN